MKVQTLFQQSKNMQILCRRRDARLSSISQFLDKEKLSIDVNAKLYARFTYLPLGLVLTGRKKTLINPKIIP